MGRRGGGEVIRREMRGGNRKGEGFGRFCFRSVVLKVQWAGMLSCD
jgi:hypothetical protein